MHKFTWVFLVCCLLVAGCSKVELPPDDMGEEPLFFARLLFEGGGVFEESAGEDNYYLFTEDGADDQGVWVYGGRLAQTDCAPNCGPSFSVLFRDEVAGFSTPLENWMTEQASFAYAGPAPSQNDTLVQYGVSLQSVSQTGGVQVPEVWTINDSVVYTGTLPPLIFESSFPLEVKLTLSDPGSGCWSEQSRIVTWTGGTNCGVYIMAGDSLGSALTAVPQNGQPPFSYFWSTGETVPTIQANQPGTYCVNLIDSEGCVSISCVEIQPNPVQSICTAIFEYETFEQDSVVIGSPGFLQLGKVVLVYLDENGVEYRSDRSEQPVGSSFQIEESAFYEENENGQPTRSFSAIFNGTLWSSAGESLKITEGYAKLAVAYPE